MADKKIYTHGDAFALIDPLKERNLTRIFFVLGIGEKAYLATKQGTVLSDRNVPYIDNELQESDLKKLMGKFEYIPVGIFPQAYGLMTEVTRTKLTDGKWAIEVFDDGWKRKETSAEFNDNLTYRGVKKRCQTCGHSA